MNINEITERLDKIWVDGFHCSKHKQDYDELVHRIGKLIHDIKRPGIDQKEEKHEIPVEMLRAAGQAQAENELCKSCKKDCGLQESTKKNMINCKYYDKVDDICLDCEYFSECKAVEDYVKNPFSDACPRRELLK